MGVIINRSADITVADLFQQIKLEAEPQPILKETVHFGGPVQTERGFILHDIMSAPHEEFNSTMVVNNTVALTTSKDILEATAQHKGPQKMLIALGYAGWTAGQLENELAQNAWLSLEINNPEKIHALIFDKPDSEKFDCAMGLMGLNLANLSEVAGHA